MLHKVEDHLLGAGRHRRQEVPRGAGGGEDRQRHLPPITRRTPNPRFIVVRGGLAAASTIGMPCATSDECDVGLWPRSTNDRAQGPEGRRSTRAMAATPDARSRAPPHSFPARLSHAGGGQAHDE